jgi:RNA polymerase sigma factor (sigma-70 family)
MSKKQYNKDEMNKIVKGCLNNNIRSQKALFDMYAGQLMSISYRYMGNYDEADEVLQESFIKIFVKLTTYRPSTDTFNVYHWMKSIVVNTAIDALRKRKRERKIVSNDQDNMFKTTDHDELYDFEKLKNNQAIANILMDAISKLSPAYRTVFNMYVIEDYSHAEVAEELGISEGTSKSNYFKAKARLRELLKDKMDLIYQS